MSSGKNRFDWYSQHLEQLEPLERLELASLRQKYLRYFV